MNISSISMQNKNIEGSLGNCTRLLSRSNLRHNLHRYHNLLDNAVTEDSQVWEDFLEMLFTAV